MAIVAVFAVAAMVPAGAAPGQGSATVQLSYVDKASDKVGSGSQATPGGGPDGHFQLAVTANDTVTTITLKTADASGQPCCGQVWNTQPRDAWWILGVFRSGTQLNPVDKNISDPVAGSVTYDIYGTDTGLFKPGQRFVVYVNLASGRCVSALTQIGGQSSAGGSCPTVQIGPPTVAGWNANAAGLRGQNGSRFTVVCPAAGTPGPVWGANTYTDSSSICTAAVHVGLIALASGGTVAIEIRPGQSSYPSFAHNGITTRALGSWPGSFRFPSAAVIPGSPGGGAAPPSTTTTPTGSSAPPATGTATGTVLVNGRPFTAGRIPYNSTVDVTNGTLLLKTDTGSLTVHGAGGISAIFVLLRGTDNKKPIVELRLTKGNFSVCGKRKKSSAVRVAATTVRQLWGNGTGRFRTRGKYSAATVRGTNWLTADRCDGTQTKVVRGIVQVADFPQRRQVTLRAGRSYLAKP